MTTAIMQVPRLSTILQSLDAARYQDDTAQSKQYDIAQARTETLMAILFGRTIVIPAGYVADSPGFQELFTEVYNGLEKHRQKLYNKSSYRPFSIGLEAHFNSYDDFVAAYVHSGAKTVVLGDLASENDASPDEFIAAMSRAFLERHWMAIERIGGPGFFFRRIASEFCESEQLGLTVSKAFPDRPFTGSAIGLGAPLTAYLDRSREKFDHSDVFQAVESGISEVLSKADAPNLRGTWYKPEYKSVFGDYWDLIRNWLDFSLGNEFAYRYDIEIPSYFLQEVPNGKYDSQLLLAFLGQDSIDRVESNDQADEVAGGMNQVDWERIWEMVSDDQFQRSIQKLNRDIYSAIHQERKEIEQYSSSKTAESIKQKIIVDKARDFRQASVQIAMNEHIDRVLGDLPDFSVESKIGRIYLKLKDKTQNWTKENTMAKIALEGAPAAVGSIVPNILLASMGMPEAAINHGITAIAGGVGADQVAKLGSRTVSKLARPSELAAFGMSRSKLDSQVDDVNFWIGCSYSFD
ncbi:hypothetical protein A8B75_07765 [Sphingomonadales bacterium EhC05]|nr:hypothetical protein A8B75_07765 [Sphingomonadales bacterium EhC05]